MRYLLFCFENYYPCGGGSDFVSAHEYLDEAIEKSKLNKEETGYELFNVFDVTTLQIVAKGRCE